MAASLSTLLLGEFTPSPSVPGRSSFNIAQRPLKERLGLGAYYEVMGRLSIERVKDLQREIAEIAAGNHAYFACRKPDLPKKLLHERRHERLQEIKEELAALLRRSAA
jgi:hypothetical protein